MNLKNNKGYTGTDIIMSVLVLLIFIPTITATIYNVSKNSKLSR